MPMRRSLLGLALVMAVAASCTSGGDDPAPSGSGGPDEALNAIAATTDLYAGDPQRVGIGLVLNDGRLVSYGSADMRFSYQGDGSASTPAPTAGPSATAVYVPTPGTPEGGTTPVITQPSEGRGVYEAEGVVFDEPGYWQVDVLVDVDGKGTMRASTVLGVTAEPALPAPGHPALETENLTLKDHDDAPLGAVDSRATSEGVVPDKILHEMTIAEALDRQMPIVVVFSTPVFCQTQFCGPVTDVIQGLAERYSDRAAFIHVEIYRHYEPGNVVVNQAAADWLLRNNDLTEPWVYLIGADGTIQDRWAVLFRAEELEADLQALPKLHN
jgi:hypothetical protein